jgi:glutamate synthase domain-containing protein 1
VCGIVGLLIRDETLEPQLGSLVVPMLSAMGARGFDSTGIAFYRDADPGRCRVTVHRRSGVTWSEVTAVLDALDAASLEPAGSGVAGSVLVAEGDIGAVSSPVPVDQVLAALASQAPAVVVAGFGAAVEVIKDTGGAAEVCTRYHIDQRHGYLALGHTRMATESAVTAAHSHPFVPAADLCLVHNGSFSNHATVRRRLEAEGWHFDSDNDSEVAARYIASRLAEGDDLAEAVRWLTKELDGFFTLAITTADSLAVVRDAVSCKPAVVAETDAYVAMASEYRALATLPGIDQARVFEPSPEEIYLWTR